MSEVKQESAFDAGGLDDEYKEKYKTAPDIIRLNIGGIKFETSKSTLMKSHYFSGLLSGNFIDSKTNDGYYFIDRNGKIFEYLLNYMRCGYVLIPNKYITIIKMESEFYGIKIDLTKYTELKSKPNLFISKEYLRSVLRINGQSFNSVYESYGISKDKKQWYENDLERCVGYFIQHKGYQVSSSSMSHNGDKALEKWVTLKPIVPEYIVIINKDNQ